MKAFVVLLLLWATACAAQPTAAASLEQHVGAPVPLDVPVQDDLGQPARLADFFQPRQPVLLVLGYYRCPQLCGLVMQSLLQGLHGAGVASTGWRVVGLSIDPHDTPADAHRRRDLDLDYARYLQSADENATLPRVDLLVAQPAQVQRIAHALGFTYSPDATGIAHPATVALITPSGTVARYFNGIGIDPPELRSALLQATDGGIGGWTDRLALLCAHLSPTPGRYTDMVLAALRVLGVLTLAAVAWTAWRNARQRRPR